MQERAPHQGEPHPAESEPVTSAPAATVVSRQPNRLRASLPMAARPRGVYDVQIRATTTEAVSPWTDTSRVVVLDPPVSVGGGTNLIEMTVTVTWITVPGADSYLLQLVDAAGTIRAEVATRGLTGTVPALRGEPYLPRLFSTWGEHRSAPNELGWSSSPAPT